MTNTNFHRVEDKKSSSLPGNDEGYLQYIKGKISQWNTSDDFINLAGSSVVAIEEAFLADLQNKHKDEFEELFHGTHDRMYGDVKLVEEIRRRCHLPDTVEVLPVAGASMAIAVVMQALTHAGKCRVLVENPTYDPLHRAARYFRADIDRLPRDERFRIDPEVLRSKLNSEVDAVVISNLHNPSGIALSQESLTEISELLAGENPAAWLIVDETFADFSTDPSQAAAAIGSNVVSINTLSKVYGLSLLRCGWVIATGDKFHQIRESWVNCQNIGSKLTEAMAAVFLRHSDEYVSMYQDTLSENRKRVATLIDSHSDKLAWIAPEHGCICFPRFTGKTGMGELVARFEQAGVGVVPGRFFGVDQYRQHFRIGYGIAQETLEKGLRRIAKVIATAQ